MRTILAVIVTAVITSLFWIIVYNLPDAEEGRAPPAVTVRGAPATNAAANLRDESALAPAEPDLPDREKQVLIVPVQGVSASELTDTFPDARGGGERAHQALDIMAPEGTPVLAAAAGRVEKLFKSDEGGNTIYIRSPGRQREYYYAHLNGYAPELVEGQAVEQGQRIGFVGSTGNADAAAPHLHFQINVMDPLKRWYQSGRPINPYPLLVHPDRQ